MSANGMLNCEIAAAIGVHPNTVASIVTKYISAGKDYALNDTSRSSKPNTISDEEKLWVTSIACTKPKELGYAQELWTYRKLRDHIRTHCGDAGYPGLAKISANTVYSILASNEIKPNKIKLLTPISNGGLIFTPPGDITGSAKGGVRSTIISGCPPT